MAINQQRIYEFLGAFPAEFIHLSDTEQRISAQIYRLLAKGDPLPVADLASSLDLPLAEVEEVVGQWTGLFYNDDKAISGYWGLAQNEMGHKFEVDALENLLAKLKAQYKKRLDQREILFQSTQKLAEEIDNAQRRAADLLNRRSPPPKEESLISRSRGIR